MVRPERSRVTASAQTTGRRKGGKKASSLWFALHGWLGLPIWGFLFLICLTGSVATISQEIVWLAQPEVRASKPDGDPPMLGFRSDPYDNQSGEMEADGVGLYGDDTVTTKEVLKFEEVE